MPVAVAVAVPSVEFEQDVGVDDIVGGRQHVIIGSNEDGLSPWQDKFDQEPDSPSPLVFTVTFRDEAGQAASTCIVQQNCKSQFDALASPKLSSGSVALQLAQPKEEL